MLLLEREGELLKLLREEVIPLELRADEPLKLRFEEPTLLCDDGELTLPREDGELTLPREEGVVDPLLPLGEKVSLRPPLTEPLRLLPELDGVLPNVERRVLLSRVPVTERLLAPPTS